MPNYPGTHQAWPYMLAYKKKVISDQMMSFFDHFGPFLAQKWLFSGQKVKKLTHKGTIS